MAGGTIAKKLVSIGILLTALGLVGFLLFPALSEASVPLRINFQGKVVNTDGTNVTDNDYDFTFRIYDASSGGNLLWTEDWNSGTSQIGVKDGIFQVELGTYTSLAAVDFTDPNVYLSVEFNSDSEMDPRIHFTSSPYALNSQKVNGLNVTETDGTLTIPNGGTVAFANDFSTVGNFPLTLNVSGATDISLPSSGTLGTLDGAETLTNKTIGSTGLVFSGASDDITTPAGEDFSIMPGSGGNVGIGTNDPRTLLTLNQSSAGNVFAIRNTSDSADVYTLDNSGNVVAAGNISLSGTSPNITATGTDQSITIDANGTGDVNIAGSSTGDINFGGGSGSSGCTIDNSTGNLLCSGTIATTATSGQQGWWTRSGTTLAPSNSGDSMANLGDISASGLLSLSGSGAGLSINKTGSSGNIAQFQKNGSDVFLIENDGTADFLNNDTKNFRIENTDGSVTTPTCDATTQGRMYYDTSADSAFVCIETAPGVYGWFDYTQTSVQSNKVVTVGSSGADYTTISAAAAYLNALGGGMILLTPETHSVNSSIDLENISLIGANTADTRINITGSGSLRVKETQFKSMTINVDSGISASSGLDAKYDAATTSSIIFEWVDFITNGTKVLINSSELTAPTIRTRFISTSTTSGTQKIFLPKATANLNTNSYHFVESQGGSGTLDIEDWNVKIAGSSNVTTSGTIETIPNSTIFVYPGMNLQGAVDSISSGGVITILPGVHTISSPISITRDDIQIEGYGDASIIRASGFTGGATVAAIQIGAMDGTAPNDRILLRDFKLEVSGTGASDINGIRMAGGEDNQLLNLSIIKTSGASGTGASARMGVQMIDGTGEKLVRPVIKGCRILGTSSAVAYFTDGIHVTGGASYGAGSGIWTNGAGIDGALVDGNYVDYVRETVAAFVGVNNSSLYNNRFSRMGVGGGGAFGVFFGNSSNVNMTANVVATSLSSASYGIVIDTFNTGSLKSVTDSVFTANTVDGAANGGVGFAYGIDIGNASNTKFDRNVFANNVINGASNATTVAIRMNGDDDDNNFSNNVINGNANAWDTGISINSASSERNLIGKTSFINTTTNISDSGVATQMNLNKHEATSSPTVNDDSADGYSVGTVWVNTSTQNAYMATSVAVGAAVWEQIDATGGGSADLDTVYTNDADKVMNVNNAAGLEFASTSAGNISLDLQSTGDLVFQDNNSTFLTISDTGGFDYTLDAADNPSFAINNLGTGEFRINDQAGDTTPFVIDQNGNVGIGTTSPSDKMDLVQSVAATSNDALGIAYTQGTNASNLSGAGIRITATSSGDAGDTLYGINIDNITPTSSSEIGMRIGTGWDYDLVFSDSTPTIRIENGAVLSVVNNNNTTLFQVSDMGTNFGGVMSTGAFIGRNSTLTEEFNKKRGDIVNDTVGGGASNNGVGDGGGWGGYENGNCSITTPNDVTNGVARVQANATNSGCAAIVDDALRDRRNIIDADNLPVFLFKVRPSNVGANNQFFIGTANDDDGNLADPTNFIGFTNNGGTTWTGRTTSGGTSTNVACTGQTISTSAFALLMIEVRSTTDVRFYVDTDVSNGVSFSSCGTSANNVPAGALAPEIMYKALTGGTANTYIDTDFYRVWQDDASTQAQPEPVALAKIETDLSTESSITQVFPSDDPGMEEGTLVQTDVSDNMKAIPAKVADDIVGVITKDSSMEIDNGTIDGVKVATYGRASVKVSSENGKIKAGDYLTVSGQPGIAAKAKENGKVLGKALEDFKGNDGETGMIAVMIDIQNAEIKNNEAFQVDDGFATTDLDLSVLGNLVLDKSLVVSGAAKFNDMVFFDGLVNFKDSAEFSKDVTLERAPILGSDAAGLAKIDKGKNNVEVQFKTPYDQAPVIQANWYLPPKDGDKAKQAIFTSSIKYIVSNVDATGFTIELDQDAPEELTLSWTAFSQLSQTNK